MQQDDYQMQQANEMEKLVQELEENVNEMNSDIEKTVKVLLEVAEILDNHCKNCQIFSAVGRFSAVFCDCLGIAGNLDVITDDYAGSLAMASTTSGMSGAVLNVWQAYKASSELLRVTDIEREAIKSIRKVTKNIDVLRSGENRNRLLFLAEHVIKRFGSGHFILSLIEESLPVDVLYRIPVNTARDASELVLKAGGAYAGIGPGIKTVAKTVGETGAKVATSTAGDVGVSIASEGSSVVARAAAWSSHCKGSVRAAEYVGPNVRAINIEKFQLTFGACGDATAAEKYVPVAEIGRNTASFRDASGRDVTQESGAWVGAEIRVPFGTKFVRSIITAGFLVWDCKTLYNTLNDIKNNKGSDVSKYLRKRARAFEALLPAHQE